jgi:hypothetical protein
MIPTPVLAIAAVHHSVIFFSFSTAKPWWVSILHPNNGSEESSLTHLLGFEHHVGLQFLMVTGLIKKSIQNPAGYAAVPHEWEIFAIEETKKIYRDICYNYNGFPF